MCVCNLGLGNCVCSLGLGICACKLDFLGFGLPAGSPSLGELLAQGKANLHSPWLGLSGFFTLLLLLTLLIFIGEAVRDAFDPRRSATGLDSP